MNRKIIIANMEIMRETYHGNDLSHLIDVTNFQTVLNALAYDLEIDNIINVGEQDLGAVATAFWKGDVEWVTKLFNERKLTADRVNPENAVDVIYLPPCYLFKDRGIKYE